MTGEPDITSENVSRACKALRGMWMGPYADMLEAIATQRDRLNMRAANAERMLTAAEAKLAESDGTRIEGAIMIFNDQSVEHWGRNSTVRFCNIYCDKKAPIRIFPREVCDWLDAAFAEIAERRALEGEKP